MGQMLLDLLASRKVGVGLIVILVVVAGKNFLHLSDEDIQRIFYAGLAIIAGISVEDAAHKFGLPPPGTEPPEEEPPKPPAA